MREILNFNAIETVIILSAVSLWRVNREILWSESPFVGVFCVIVEGITICWRVLRL